MKIKVRNKGYADASSLDALVLERHTYSGEKFANRQLCQLVSIGSKFNDCDFANLSIIDCNFGAGKTPSIYYRCRFDAIRTPHISFGYSQFTECHFSGFDFEGLRISTTDLIRCTFIGRMRNGYIASMRSGFDPPSLGLKERSVIQDNDFSEVDFVHFNFKRGVDLTRQRLPTGSNYVLVLNGMQALEKVKQSLLLDDATIDIRTSVMSFLEILSSEAKKGQENIFLREEDFGSMNYLAREFLFNQFRAQAELTKEV